IADQRRYRFDIITIVAKLVGNVVPFDITEVAHPAHEFLANLIVVRRSRSNVSDARDLARLLRLRRERPRARRAAEQRDEFAPSSLIELHPIPLEPRPSTDRISKFQGSVRSNGTKFLQPCQAADV